MDGVSLRRDEAGGPAVAEIVLDRPDALNALDTAMARRLAAVCADAAEAYRIGLADRLAPAAAARDDALHLAGLIARNSPVAVRAAKQAIRQGSGTALAAGLDIEDAAWRTAAFSGDRREGIAAFNEKREPRWPGE